MTTQTSTYRITFPNGNPFYDTIDIEATSKVEARRLAATKLNRKSMPRETVIVQYGSALASRSC